MVMECNEPKWADIPTSISSTHRVIRVGNCSNGTSEGGMVYSPKGVSQTITAGTHGYGCGNILVEVSNE